MEKSERDVVAPVAFGAYEFDALDVLSVKHGIRGGNVEIYGLRGEWFTVKGGDRQAIASEIDGARFDAWMENPWQEQPPEPIE